MPGFTGERSLVSLPEFFEGFLLRKLPVTGAADSGAGRRWPEGDQRGTPDRRAPSIARPSRLPSWRAFDPGGPPRDSGRAGRSTRVDRTLADLITSLDKCLNEHRFVSMADAQIAIEAWRLYYNTVRPHSALENRRRRSLPASRRGLGG